MLGGWKKRNVKHINSKGGYTQSEGKEKAKGNAIFVGEGNKSFLRVQTEGKKGKGH